MDLLSESRFMKKLSEYNSLARKPWIVDLACSLMVNTSIHSVFIWKGLKSFLVSWERP